MFWASIPGYWGSLVLYAMPWIFTVLQITISLKGKITDSPGSYTLFLLIVYLSLWFLNSLLHIVYVPRMDAYIMTKINSMAKSQTKCPLKRGKMTDAEYIAAC